MRVPFRVCVWTRLKPGPKVEKQTKVLAGIWENYAPTMFKFGEHVCRPYQSYV